MIDLSGLNPEQRSAVSTTEGPVLVLAGAGSGKTRVVTMRIAHLMEKGVPPSAILALTFTNKAAGEMRERVAALVGKERAQQMFCGTFHSFCVRLLRRYGESIGLDKKFTLCDSSDQLSIAKGALRELRVGEKSISPGELKAKISLAKNRLQHHESALEAAKDDEDELVAKAWARYEDQMARSRVLDFDDLLVKAVELLRTSEASTAALRERFRYVMVDEFQDTNAPQFEVVRRIVSEHRNLCVVGDDDQSIYGWRGADSTKILGFERDFPGAKVIRLETNYRSTEPILTAANKLIVHNSKRHDKELRSHLGEGDPVRLFGLESEGEEADFTAREILGEVRSEKALFKDYCVLLRTAAQARPFETQFRARGIPYILVGGQSFFDRKEVRDVLAYLRLLVNRDDETAFLRVLNRPPRGIGKTSLDRAMNYAIENGISVMRAFELGEDVPKLPKLAIETVRQLRHNLDYLGRDDPKDAMVKRIEDMLEIFDYRAEVNRAYPDEHTQELRWNVVEEVVEMAANFVANRKRPTLAKFLEDLTLQAEDKKDDDKVGKKDAVTLMTLHAAKGLEFPRVYLVGMEEGYLPHLRSVHEDTVDEERRLGYVGITRAQFQLTLTYCLERSKFGRKVASHPSRFLFEIRGQKPPADWVAAGDVPPARPKRKSKRRTSRSR